MMNPESIYMIRSDELLNILEGLALTDCDQRNLTIVARSTGLGDYFKLPDPPSTPAYVVIAQPRQIESSEGQK